MIIKAINAEKEENQRVCPTSRAPGEDEDAEKRSEEKRLKMSNQ